MSLGRLKPYQSQWRSTLSLSGVRHVVRCATILTLIVLVASCTTITPPAPTSGEVGVIPSVTSLPPAQAPASQGELPSLIVLMRGTTISLYDADSGYLVDERTFAVSPGQTYVLASASGDVTFTPFEDPKAAINPAFGRVLGFATGELINPAIAEVLFTDQSRVVFRSPVTMSNDSDFSQVEPADVRDGAYDPTGEVWWVSEQGDEYVVRKGQDGAVQGRVKILDVSFPPTFEIIFSSDATDWALSYSAAYGGTLYAYADGSEQENLRFTRWRAEIGYNEMLELVPETNYRVRPGIYSNGSGEFAFAAVSPNGVYSIFVSDGAGSEPRKVLDLPEEQRILFYGEVGATG